MQLGTPSSAHKDLHRVAFHIFIPGEWSGDSEYKYRVDDGISFDYRQGRRSAVTVKLTSTDGNVAVAWERDGEGYGQIDPTFVIHGKPKSFRVNNESGRKSDRATLTGKPLAVDVVNVR